MVEGAASAGNSTLGATTNNQAADGVSANVVQGTIFDDNGNPLAGEVVNFTADNGATIITSCVTNANGQCSVDVTNTVAGDSVITATVSGLALSNSPITVSFSEGDADASNRTWGTDDRCR